MKVNRREIPERYLYSYLNLAVHIVLGFLLFFIEPLSLVYFFAIFLYFTYKIIRFPQDPKWVLMACAYVTGAEIFLRMTNGIIFWETGKYMVILFTVLGIYNQGFKLRSWPYLVFILLLLPGIFITYVSMDFYEVSFRKNILFNISGPLSLFMSALYCFQLKINLQSLFKVFDFLVYPLISMCIYIVLYTPTNKEVFTAAESNAAASGGYSGNQVATILGLGVFLLFVRFLIPYRKKIFHYLMMGALVLLTLRGLLTFSRGGMLAGAIMIAFFSVIYYSKVGLKGKAIATSKFVIIGIGLFAIWSYSLARTDGMIYNRYSGRNALGEKEEDVTTGRIKILEEEIDAFFDSPFLGIGVGRTKFFRLENTGIGAPTHNEITRLLGEHGFLGILALLILLLTPAYLNMFGGNKNMFWIPMMVFWGATINHSAMRIAAPGFVYGLALLNIQYPRIRRRARQQLKTYQRKYHGLQTALSR